MSCDVKCRCSSALSKLRSSDEDDDGGCGKCIRPEGDVFFIFVDFFVSDFRGRFVLRV